MVRQFRYPRGPRHRARLVARDHPYLPFGFRLFCRRFCNGRADRVGRNGPRTEVRLYASPAPVWKGITGPYEDALGELDVWGDWEGGVEWERGEGYAGLEGVQVFLWRVSYRRYLLVMSEQRADCQ